MISDEVQSVVEGLLIRSHYRLDERTFEIVTDVPFAGAAGERVVARLTACGVTLVSRYGYDSDCLCTACAYVGAPSGAAFVVQYAAVTGGTGRYRADLYFGHSMGGVVIECERLRFDRRVLVAAPSAGGYVYRDKVSSELVEFFDPFCGVADRMA